MSFPNFKLVKDEAAEIDGKKKKKKGVEEVEGLFSAQKIMFHTWASIDANNSSNFFKSDFKWHYICSEA